MKYVIVDVEATCWENRSPSDISEIIEIGSVILNSVTLDIEKQFTRFVKPFINPILSEFCIRLTTIQQKEIDGAEHFPVVLQKYMDWMGNGDITICSWGDYDKYQFESDCKLHGLYVPDVIAQNHLNLKAVFARTRGIKRCGMAAALKILGIPYKVNIIAGSMTRVTLLQLQNLCCLNSNLLIVWSDSSVPFSNRRLSPEAPLRSFRFA